MKNLKLLGLLALSVSCISATTAPIRGDESLNGYRVDFFNNYLRQEFTLSNGTKGKGDNLIYQSVNVEKDALVHPSELRGEVSPASTAFGSCFEVYPLGA